MIPSCCICNTTATKLRNYGPGGKPICFDCAMKPDQIATTEAQFAVLLDNAKRNGAPLVIREAPPKGES